MNSLFSSLFSSFKPTALPPPIPPSTEPEPEIIIYDSNPNNDIEIVSAKPIITKKEDEEEEEEKIITSLTSTIYLKWIPSEPCTSSSFQSPSPPPFPYLYKILVLNFFHSLSTRLSLPLSHIMNINRFYTTTTTGLYNKDFDQWFLSCCNSVYYAVERAWSLIQFYNPDFFSTHFHLVLGSNSIVRAHFVELCILVYNDIKIQTLKWNHYECNNNEYTLVLSKKEIRAHENRKRNVLLFFQSQRSGIDTTNIQTMFSSPVLSFKQLGYNDINLDHYNLQLKQCEQTTTSGGSNYVHECKTNRDCLTWMEYQASNITTTYDADINIFVNQELDLERIIYPHKLSDVRIINNALLRVLIATNIALRYRLNESDYRLTHIPVAMRNRLSKSLVDTTTSILHAIDYIDPFPIHNNNYIR